MANIDTMLSISGVREYTDSIKNITTQLNILKTNMKVVSEEYKNNANSVDALKARQDILKRQISEQSEIVEHADRVLGRFKLRYEETSYPVTYMTKEINNQKASLFSYQNQLEEVNQKLENASAKESSFAQEYERSQKSIKEGEMNLRLYTAQLSAVEKQYKDTGDAAETDIKRMEILQKAYGQSRAIVAELEQQLKWHSDTLGKDSDGYKEMQINLVHAQSRVNEFEQAINSSDAQLHEHTKTTLDYAQAVKSNFVGNLIASGIERAAGAIGSYVRQGSMMALESAESQGQLVQVMRNTMDATDAEIESVNELAAAQQRLGVIEDDLQIAAAQELATYISKSETLRQLIPVMNDMAAQQLGVNASQEGAVSIATMLGKVMEGQAGALSRYGYSFNEAQENILKTGTESERAAVLIDVVSASVGGMNEALALTDAGKQAQLNIVLGETQERIGEIWNELRMEASAETLPAVEALSNSLLDFINENEGNLKAFMGILADGLTFLLDNSGAVLAFVTSLGAGAASAKFAEWAEVLILSKNDGKG